jgi:flagellar assembly factor FliW
MLLNTLQFGELTIEEKEIFTFPYGIPGFEDYSRYIFIRSDEASPFVFMQCVDEGNLSLIIANPFTFYPEYDFVLSDTVQAELGIANAEDVAVWNVVSVKEQAGSATLNLLAPIIVNVNSRQAKQVILHQSEYKTNHQLNMALSVE